MTWPNSRAALPSSDPVIRTIARVLGFRRVQPQGQQRRTWSAGSRQQGARPVRRGHRGSLAQNFLLNPHQAVQPDLDGEISL
jgi:hypothetical protein